MSRRTVWIIECRLGPGDWYPVGALHHTREGARDRLRALKRDADYTQWRLAKYVGTGR